MLFPFIINAQIKVFSDGTVAVGSTTAPPSGYVMQLTGKSLFSDNVGIGISTPGSRLDVAGNINVGTSNAFQINSYPILWNNGNAGSEACSIGRSADRSILTYSAYTGDIGSIPGTPSSLPYHRIISVIDAFGTSKAAYIGAYPVALFGGIKLINIFGRYFIGPCHGKYFLF